MRRDNLIKRKKNKSEAQLPANKTLEEESKKINFFLKLTLVNMLNSRPSYEI
jgi:hypothetical protein